MIALIIVLYALSVLLPLLALLLAVRDGRAASKALAGTKPGSRAELASAFSPAVREIERRGLTVRPVRDLSLVVAGLAAGAVGGVWSLFL